MKTRQTLWMQAAIIGIGAAFFIAVPTRAQEIVNTEFNDGPYVTSFAQPEVAPVSVAASTEAVTAEEVAKSAKSQTTKQRKGATTTMAEKQTVQVPVPVATRKPAARAVEKTNASMLAAVAEPEEVVEEKVRR